MRLSLVLPILVGAAALAGAMPTEAQAPTIHAPEHVHITVHQGTSMAVSVSPDGKMLAMDLQGSIWVLPVTGGPAKRITDLFNDARRQEHHLLRLSRWRLRPVGSGR